MNIDPDSLSPAQLVCFELATAYSADEVAEKLRVDERTVRSWIAKGELRAVNLSRDRGSRKPRLRVLEAEVERFLEARSTHPDVKPLRRRRRVPPPVERFV